MSSYSDFANSASDILLKKGEALAQGKARSGELWGGTIAQLGDVVPKQVQQVMQQVAAKKKTAQIQAIIQQSGGDLEKALPQIMGIDATIGAHLADEHAKVQKSVAEVQKIKEDAAKAQLDYSDRLWSQVSDEGSYAHAAMVDKALGGVPLDHYDPDWVKQKKQSLLSLKDQLEAKKPIVVPRGGTLTTPEGTVLAKGEAFPEPQPTTASLALQAAGGDPSAAMQSLQAPAMLSAERAQAAQAETARHNKAEEGLTWQLRTIEATREKREGATATPVEIKPGSPEYRIAADLASGKMTFSQFRTLAAYNRNAALKFGIYDTARQLNPEFDPAQYELGFKMASNPAIRQRIVAINALNPVIDQVSALVDKTGNTDYPTMNKIIQGAKMQIGNKDVTNFRQMQILLGDEVGMALGIGTGSDLKTRLGLDLVNPNLGPAQFKSTMEQLRSVLDARRAELYKQMGVYGGGIQNPPNQAAPAPTTPAPQGGVSGRVGPYTYVVR